MERMEESKLAKRIIQLGFSERLRGKPHLEWISCVNRALNERGMNVQQPGANMYNIGKWRVTLVSA